MTSIVGLFPHYGGALAASVLLDRAGYDYSEVAVLGPADETPNVSGVTPPLLERGESMLRTGVRWAIAGALAVEIPFVAFFLMLPADNAVKVLMLASAWKFGAAFGGWLGMMFGGERGLEQETAEAYRFHLGEGRWVVAADVRRRDRAIARGAMVESGALEARDIRGTFEPKPTTHWLRRY